jgi:transcriptional regulator with PAS, ATPase and Fis domain
MQAVWKGGLSMTELERIELESKRRKIDVLLANGLEEEAKKLAKMMGLDYKFSSSAERKPGEKPQIQIDTEVWLNRFITQDPRMMKLKEHVRILAAEEDTVIIYGPSGTGKEILANALHGNRAGSFVPVNCAGLPESLIESELFGYMRGAFTGADKDKAGLFEQATNGTLFLDEIGELPLTVQAKLLRALQERKIRRVGGKVEISVNCRVISATHQNLRSMIDSSTFRLDLYFRLGEFVLTTTPLSSRWGDIPLIVKHTIDKEGKFPIEFNWECVELEGNVRSVKQIVRRYLVLNELP